MSAPAARLSPEDLQGRGDVAEAALLAVVVVYVYGLPAIPPRLRSVWRLTVPEAALPSLDQRSVGAWIAEHHGDHFARILDWAAVGAAARLPWSTREAAEVYASGLP